MKEDKERRQELLQKLDAEKANLASIEKIEEKLRNDFDEALK